MLIDIIKNITKLEKDIDISKLPSQGLFYPDDLEIKIKRVDKSKIIEYESDWKDGNIQFAISKIKEIVRTNISLSYNYTFEDVKSIDIVFLFLEIVNLTRGKNKIKIKHEVALGMDVYIEFNKENFNYFDYSDHLKYYNEKEKCFEVNGYKYSLPTIGVEYSLTNFLASCSNDPKYANYFYDFTYFLGNRNHLSYKEVDNIIKAYNLDLSKDELEKAKNVIKMFSPFLIYSLNYEGNLIELTSKLKLKDIFNF